VSIVQTFVKMSQLDLFQQEVINTVNGIDI